MQWLWWLLMSVWMHCRWPGDNGDTLWVPCWSPSGQFGLLKPHGLSHFSANLCASGNWAVVAAEVALCPGLLLKVPLESTDHFLLDPGLVNFPVFPRIASLPWGIRTAHWCDKRQSWKGAVQVIWLVVPPISRKMKFIHTKLDKICL